MSYNDYDEEASIVSNNSRASTKSIFSPSTNKIVPSLIDALGGNSYKSNDNDDENSIVSINSQFSIKSMMDSSTKKSGKIIPLPPEYFKGMDMGEGPKEPTNKYITNTNDDDDDANNHNPRNDLESGNINSNSINSNISMEDHQLDATTKHKKDKKKKKNRSMSGMSGLSINGLTLSAIGALVIPDHSLLKTTMAFEEVQKALKIIMFHRFACRSGLIFLMIGLFCAFTQSMLEYSPQYNTVIILVLLIAREFPYFPVAMRPYILLTVFTTFSVVLDFFYLFAPRCPDASKVLIAITFLSKGQALTEFLYNAVGTTHIQARKYIFRRVRIFGLAFTFIPYRLMREIRYRLLAICCLEIISFIVYFVLFIISIEAMGADRIMSNPTVGMGLSTFLLIKTFSSAIMAVSILVDTDITLFMGTFGMLCCCMKYYRHYILKRREELGGWPLVYAFNSMRVNFIGVGKCLDFCFGIVGWVTLGTCSGSCFSNAASNLKAFLISVYFIMLISEIWCGCLMYYVFYLVKQLKKRRGKFAGGYDVSIEDSDDSELDELHIRDEDLLNITKKEKKLRRQKKKKKLLKQLEKERRLKHKYRDNKEHGVQYKRGTDAGDTRGAECTNMGEISSSDSSSDSGSGGSDVSSDLSDSDSDSDGGSDGASYIEEGRSKVRRRSVPPSAATLTNNNNKSNNKSRHKHSQSQGSYKDRSSPPLEHTHSVKSIKKKKHKHSSSTGTGTGGTVDFLALAVDGDGEEPGTQGQGQGQNDEYEYGYGDNQRQQYDYNYTNPTNTDPSAPANDYYTSPMHDHKTTIHLDHSTPPVAKLDLSKVSDMYSNLVSGEKSNSTAHIDTHANSHPDSDSDSPDEGTPLSSPNVRVRTIAKRSDKVSNAFITVNTKPTLSSPVTAAPATHSTAQSTMISIVDGRSISFSVDNGHDRWTQDYGDFKMEPEFFSSLWQSYSTTDADGNAMATSTSNTYEVSLNNSTSSNNSGSGSGLISILLIKTHLQSIGAHVVAYSDYTGSKTGSTTGSARIYATTRGFRTCPNEEDEVVIFLFEFVFHSSGGGRRNRMECTYKCKYSQYMDIFTDNLYLNKILALNVVPPSV